jgi:uncharacterized membrane protein YphA (DoxX/SURF4 family)
MTIKLFDLMKSYPANVNQRSFTSRGFLSSKSIVTICAILLAILFAYTSISKLLIYKTFVSQLHESPITKGFENILAWLVPGIELIIAAMLLVPKTKLAGLWSSVGLMFAFTVYVFIILMFFSHNKPCSCGGVVSDLSWEQHFWFNLGFTCIALTGVFLSPKIKKII